MTNSPQSRRTSPWVIALVLLGAVACLAVSCFLDFAISFGASTTCNAPAGFDVVRRAETTVAVAALVMAAPWLLAGAFARRWWVGLLSLVSAGPLVALFVAGLDPDIWSGSFCF